MARLFGYHSLPKTFVDCKVSMLFLAAEQQAASLSDAHRFVRDLFQLYSLTGSDFGNSNFKRVTQQHKKFGKL